MKQWRNVLSVTLIGFSSPRQVAYEQKVLDAIVAELGGNISRKARSCGRQRQDNIGEQIRTGLSNRLFRIAGDFFVIGGFGFDSIDQSYKMSEDYMWPLIEEGQKKGHFVEDDTHNDWLNSYQLGHYSETEPLIYFEHDLDAGARFHQRLCPDHRRGRQAQNVHHLASGPHELYCRPAPCATIMSWF